MQNETLFPLVSLLADLLNAHSKTEIGTGLLETDAVASATTLSFSSIMDESEILKLLHNLASREDLDIIEYTLHSKLTEPEPELYIIHYTFTFMEIRN